MRTRFIALTASAIVLAGGMAQAQQSPGGRMMQQPDGAPGQDRPDRQGPGAMGSGMGMSPETMRMMMERRSMMGSGMMGPGMAGGGAMGRGGMMRIVFAVMDANGDGALSLEEIQEAHARIFKGVDADNDGKVTLDELREFFHGAPVGR
jgi:hypothetical protein